MPLCTIFTKWPAPDPPTCAAPRAGRADPPASTPSTPPSGRTSSRRVRARAAAPPCCRPCGRDRSCRAPRLHLLESDARDAAAALLQRCEVACRLRVNEPTEAERLAGDRQLLAGVVDDLQEEAGGRSALVQLPRRVQVARAEAVGDDAAGRLARPRGQCEHALLVLRRRVDERLDADVVAGPRLREQLLGRALRRQVGPLARGEHLLRLVLRRLHVRLVERVDAEDRAGDGGGELPAE